VDPGTDLLSSDEVVADVLGIVPRANVDVRRHGRSFAVVVKVTSADLPPLRIDVTPGEGFGLDIAGALGWHAIIVSDWEEGEETPRQVISRALTDWADGRMSVCHRRTLWGLLRDERATWDSVQMSVKRRLSFLSVPSVSQW
jgi:hypothetical protein